MRVMKSKRRGQERLRAGTLRLKESCWKAVEEFAAQADLEPALILRRTLEHLIAHEGPQAFERALDCRRAA